MKTRNWLPGAALGIWFLWRRATRPRLALADRVVLIAGGTPEDMQALARAWLDQGAHVALTGPDAARLEAVCAALEERAAVLPLPADLTDPAAVEAVTASVRERFGRVDVLVNLPEHVPGGPAQELTAAQVRQATHATLTRTALLSRAVVPIMQNQGRGHIVNVSRILGDVPGPGSALVSGLDAGIIGFTRALRREVDPYGLRVALVLAGGQWPHTTPLATSPAATAQAVLDAVRDSRQEVISGGPLLHVAVWLERLAPWVMDRYWRWVFLPQYIADLSRASQP
ncbi:MAG: hypothetical protein Kow0077_18240 [Anaerolineae bacterium]